MRTILIIVLLVTAILSIRGFGIHSDKQRLQIWSVAAESISQHKWFGVGVDGFANPFKRLRPAEFISRTEQCENAHNDILQVLVTCGIAGLIFYALWTIGLFADARGPFLGSLVAVFILSKVNPIQLESLVIMAVLGAICLPNESVMVPGIGRVILATLGVLLASIVGILGYSDYLAKSGKLQLACSINPYEISYKKHLLLGCADIFNRSNCPDERKAVVEIMSKEVDSAIKHRPKSEHAKDVYEFGKQIERVSNAS